MIDEYFVEQMETEIYFYMLESLNEVHAHKGSLDKFPADLEYVRTVNDMPVFRKTQ